MTVKQESEFCDNSATFQQTIVEEDSKFLTQNDYYCFKSNALWWVFLYLVWVTEKYIR